MAKLMSMNHLSGIKGILFDLDGVLYIGSRAIEGAIEAVEHTRNTGFACRFITNTSILSLVLLQQKINALGFSVTSGELTSWSAISAMPGLTSC
jgi:ribonucleotide monophosphatase NagD (HAD superfamily)